MEQFEAYGCDVIGISTDDIDTHERWLTTAPERGGLGPIRFPLASDVEGSVCDKYGVYLERQRVALRGLFIIDPNGVIQFEVVHALSVGRSSEEVLRVLDAIQSGGLCPGEREQGGRVLEVLDQLGPGRFVGQYLIEAELGSGTFGTVFRAHDTVLDRKVALKLLRRNGKETTESLLDEARAAAALNHPNVCAVHTIDATIHSEMIVMEFVDGEPLSSKLADHPLPPRVAARYARQIADGMASAHAAGIIHGDLKPGNLMVTPTETVKIMDFGLARRVVPSVDNDDTLPWSSENKSNSSGQHGLSGTLAYLAPERIRGEEPSPASDTFALGLIVFEMLTGETAIQGKNFAETLRNIENFDVTQILPLVPERFHSLLQSALSQVPTDRPSMSQFAKKLR